MRRSLAGALTLASFLLAACSGSSTRPFTGNSPAPGGNQASTATLPITLVIPAQTTLAKHREDLSPSTESVEIFVYAQGGTQPTTPTATVNVGAGDSGCKSASGGVTCTIDVTAAIGNDEVTIEAFSGQNGSGTLLSTTTQTENVQATNQPVAVTFNGIPATIVLSLEEPVLAAGTAGTATLDVNAFDASGALIAGPGNFSTPLTVSSDSSAVSLSATTAAAPGTKITVSYGGGSAPYAIHLSASGNSIAANRIVGATLDIAPSQSLDFVDGTSEAPVLITVADNAANDVPQNVEYLSTPFGEGGFDYSNEFALLPNGTPVLFPSSGSNCELLAFPSGTTTQSTGAAISGYQCVMAAEANGDVLAATSSANTLTEYAFTGGTPSATGRTLSIPAQASALAVSSSGQIAVATGSFGTGTSVEVYSAGASGTASPAYTINVAAGATAVAFSADGSTLGITSKNGSTYQVALYSASSGTSLGTIAPSAPASATVSANGLAFDAAGEVLVGQRTIASSNYAYTNFVDVYPPATYGTIAPQRQIPLSTQASGAYFMEGPVVAPSPAPVTSSSTVAGDMLGYAASRTWTYTMSDGYGDISYLGIYADPQLVDGNVRLIGYYSTSSANLFTAANEIGSADFTPQNGTYLAAAFTSVASGVAGISGSVPGTPLLVPGSLTTNQSWNPLQSASLATIAGVSASAQVVSVGSVPGSSACPSGSSTNGATVEYTVTVPGSTTEPDDVSFVPGCGITAIRQISYGASATLTSVGTQSSLGQQSVKLGESPFMAALHAVWQKALHVHPPTR